MGNIGRPSTGCMLCRKRRVKCDEARPGCRKCTRLRRPCPGYRNKDHGKFRTTVITGLDEKDDALLHRKKTALADGSCATILWQAEADGQESFQPTARLSRSPGNLSEQAVWYSLAQLDRSARVRHNQYEYNFLLNILRETDANSCVHAAMRSVAVTNLANRASTTNMTKMALSEQMHALSKVNTALKSPVSWDRDETLVAVWLLSIREVTWTPPFAHAAVVLLLTDVQLLVEIANHQFAKEQAEKDTNNPRLVHLNGTIRLLELRGDRQFSSMRGRHLFRVILSSMHWRHLFQSEEPSKAYLMLEDRLSETGAVPSGAAEKLRTFFHRVTQLRWKIKTFTNCPIEGCESAIKAVVSFLQTGQALLDEFSGWCSADKEWLPRMVLPTSSPKAPGNTWWTQQADFLLYTFDQWEGFFHWNRYLVAKACLHEALLDALSALPASSSSCGTDDLISIDAESLVQELDLKETLRHFLGLIAYAFGDLVQGDGAGHGIHIPGSMQMYHPLAYFARSKHLDTGDFCLIQLALSRLKSEYRFR